MSEKMYSQCINKYRCQQCHASVCLLSVLIMESFYCTYYFNLMEAFERGGLKVIIQIEMLVIKV